MGLSYYTNLTLSILTIIGQGLILIHIASLIWPRRPHSKIIRIFVNTYGLAIALVVAIVATGGSLFYSEVIGYNPCKLCWYQRVFMYPQVGLLALAMWKKDKSVRKYSIMLASIGAIFSTYHYIIQLLAKPSFFCAPGTVDCAVRVSLHFGYITIPMMALTAFVMIILIMKNLK